jgi:cold shock CspA family protein
LNAAGDDIFVHQRSIKSDGFRSLAVDEMVEYTLTEIKVSPLAHHLPVLNKSICFEVGTGADAGAAVLVPVPLPVPVPRCWCRRCWSPARDRGRG